MNKTAQSASIDEQEVKKFSAMADQWWDEEGKFKPLHKFNPVRIAYIRDHLCQHFGRDTMQDKPLNGLKILDVGCGGGLLSVPLSRLGAKVMGIDASQTNICVAQTHAKDNDLKIDYQCISAEELAAKGKKFDVVLNMEVLEHVADVPGFLQASSQLVASGGVMFAATLNRTAKSYAFAIIGAEYVLNWLPRGTHDWKKFLKPHEIDKVTSLHGLKLHEMVGVGYNPLNDSWKLSNDISINYMMLFIKE